MPEKHELLLCHGTIATADPNIDNEYGLINDGAIIIDQGKITWIGSSKDLPTTHTYEQTIDAQQQLITPGLIDCHTHLVFAGDRTAEFEQRLQGVSYAEIAQAGGGIQATVNATRAASFDTLLASAKQRCLALLAQGVTTVEIKSGYGLDIDNELKMLKVINALQQELPMTLLPTCLGAHAIPKEYKPNPQAYVDLVCNELLPEVARQQLASAVDIFCESIGFNYQQSEQVFAQARALGFNIKGHIGQLSNINAVSLCAQYQGLSCDHIEHLSEQDVQTLAKHNMVAVLLPGAFYTLQETQRPPINLLRQYQVPMAVATDYNPGSSPILSLTTIMNMACILFGLTPVESFLGVTRHAAQALGQKQRGQLRQNKIADCIIWPQHHPRELSYGIQFYDKPLHTIIAGQWIK